MTVQALKKTRTRDTLARIVHLLTKQNINVQVRGHQAYVKTRGDKIIGMVLPELGDNATDAAIRAIQGYIDHEVGHILYTPFERAQFVGTGNGQLAQMLNIIEDIRLEKLLPRDLPGTLTNLEKLYKWVIPEVMAKEAAKHALGSDATKALGSVMIPGLRALSGQLTFQEFMDNGNYWPAMRPLLQRMPSLSRRLREMETYDDVEAISKDILSALNVKAPKPEDIEKDLKDADEDEPGDISEEGKSDAESENKDKPEESDEDGEGSKGDGSGEDDGENESDDDCSGKDGEDADGAGDEKGKTDKPSNEDADGEDADGEDADGEDADGAGDEKSGADKPSSEDGDDGEDGDEDPAGENTGQHTEGSDETKSGGGKESVSITDALKMLLPTQRKAIYLHKKKKKSVSEIANEMNMSEDEAKELVSTARRRLREIVIGGK